MPAIPSSIAILGGGISGLSAAYRLAKSLPSCQITLIESSNRLGGWMQSHKHEGGVIFESGPRTMRPKGVRGWSTIALVSFAPCNIMQYMTGKWQYRSKS